MGYYNNYGNGNNNGNVAGAYGNGGNGCGCKGNNSVAGASDCTNNSISRFLQTLTPGTCVVLQYNDQKPARGIFQGFQNGNVILSDFNGFPGLVRIDACEVNAVSPYSGDCGCHKD